MKTYRQIRQSLTEVGADREEDQNFKLGPEKMSPIPSDEEEYDELDDDIEDAHPEVDAIRPVYVRDKLGQYTHAGGLISSSGTMAQMTQQAATKNLQSEYVPEDGEVLDERSLSTEETFDEATRSAKNLGYDDKTANKTKFGPGTRKHGGADWQSRPDSGEEDAADKKNPDRESHQKYRRARGLGNVSGGHGNPKATIQAKDQHRKVQQFLKRKVVEDSYSYEIDALEENAMDSLKKIVSRQTAETIRLADGSRLKVDMTTANALLGVHGALNVHNQKKMADTLNSNKAGFAKMSKFAFKQFGSRPGKVGTPNTGVREDYDAISEVLNQHDIHEPGSRANQDTKTLELNDKIRQRSPEYRREQAAKKKRRDAERAAEKADPGGIKRGNAERLAKAKADAARRKKERLAAKKSGKEVPSPYTAHAGTARARPAAPRKSRAGLASEYTPDHGETFGEASDEKEYDNYPWTKGDLSPKQVRAKLELAKKIAKERARKRKGGGTSDVKYDEKIGRG